MSIKQMSAVWDDQSVKGTHKLVLLALADNANDEGYCWPSVRTIARKCGLSARQIQYILKGLQSTGHIKILRRNNRSNMFVVQPASPPLVQYTSPPGAVHFTPLVQPTAPDPSFDPSFDPLPEEPSDSKNSRDPQSAEGKARERIRQALANGTDKDRAIKLEIFNLFAIDPNWHTKTNKEWLEWAKTLLPGELEKFHQWWTKEDWRGKRGQPPTLPQIKEFFPQAWGPSPEDIERQKWADNAALVKKLMGEDAG